MARRDSGYQARRLLWLSLAALAAASARADGPLHVGAITIDSIDIYSPEEAARGWIYRGANRLHIPTRVGIIHKFLLFHEGDVYHPELLAESERNLRKLRFLKSATVTAAPPHDGLVDVAVITQDAWTTELGGNLGSKGGATTFAVNLRENNLLGTGRQLSLEVKRGVERSSKSLEYADPYLFGPYWTAHLLFSHNSDGLEKSASLERPFYETKAAYAFDAEAHERRLDVHIYENGRTSAVFRSVQRETLVEYGRALEASTDHARRLVGGFSSMDDTFRRAASYPDAEPPEARDLRFAYVRYELLDNDFLKLNYVNRDLRYEDFNMGRQVEVEVGVSPAFFGVDRTTGLIQVDGSRGWRLGSQSFILADGSFHTRLYGGLENGLLTLEGQYVRKFETLYRQTFVAHAQYDQGFNLDRDRQLFADGLNGLRAYRLHAFSGNRRFVLNLEQRVWLGQEILQIVTPAVAVFADVGTAIPRGDPWRVSSFKSDAGISLRLGVPRSARFNVLRIDLAYAFAADPLGRKGFLLSVTSAQSF